MERMRERDAGIPAQAKSEDSGIESVEDQHLAIRLLQSAWHLIPGCLILAPWIIRGLRAREDCEGDSGRR